MNEDARPLSNELSRIPCPLCRYSMRLKLSLPLLMAQYKDLCEHCKDKVNYVDRKCICEKVTRTRAPIDQEENELYRRIKNFYKSIVPSARLIHKTKILPLLDEYNPFQSLSVPNFGEFDTKTRQIKLADSEPNLNLGRPSDDGQITHLKYQSAEEGYRKKSDREYGSGRDLEGAMRDCQYGLGKDRELGADTDRDGAARDRQYGAGTDRDGAARDRQYGAGTNRDVTVKDRQYGAARDRDVTVKDRQYGEEINRDVTVKNRQYGAARDRDVTVKDHQYDAGTNRDGTVKDHQYDAGTNRDVTVKDRQYGAARDRDVTVKDHQYGAGTNRDVTVKDRQHGAGTNRDVTVKDRQYGAARDRDVTVKDRQYGAGTNRDVIVKDRHYGAGTDRDVTERDRQYSAGTDRDGAARDRQYGAGADDESKAKKGKYSDRLHVATKGKYDVKDTSGIVKNVDRVKGASEVKEKIERGGEKMMYAEKGKGVYVGKEKDGGKSKYAEKIIDEKEKEKKEKDGGDKVKAANDKEGDDRKGKRIKDTEKEVMRSNKDKAQIDLDSLSLSKRREQKKNGEAHKKKAVPKAKKHGDKIQNEPKSGRSDDEREFAKEKSISKMKVAEIDDDLAPLTYTEDIDREARQLANPFSSQGHGAKKTKMKIKKKNIGKKSLGSIEKIITPKVMPKILELIRKLTKSPITKDKYYERISERTSRQLDEVFYSSPKISLLDLLNVPSPRKYHYCIVGNRIIKYKPPMPKFPELEKPSISVKPRIYVKYEEKPAQIGKDSMENREDGSANDLGVMCYSLSDRSFISKGYTILPTEKIMRKLNVYRMRPSNPDNNWFARNRLKKRINYSCGQKLAVFEDDERCRIYYKNGNVALDYYQSEDTQAKERIVLYSDGENELKQKVPVTVLATFDHMGTGIIFDKKGNVRAKYNQNEGVILDKTLGPYTKWKWHKLNDPPVLEQVTMDTTLPVKDPRILRMNSKEQLPREVDEKILEIEFQNSLKEKGKKIFKSFKPFPIKMKALKINDQFSLHIMDQTKIYLAFRDGPTSFRIDVGMVLDCNEIIDTETMEMGEVDVPIERRPARTSSLLNLQRSVDDAKLLERQRHSRGQRRRPTVEPCRSLDRMHDVVSRPPRVHLPGTKQTVFPCACRKSTIL